MEKKSKIKLIVIAIGSFLTTLFFTVLGIKRRRSSKSSKSNTRSYDEYHKDAESTNNRIRDNIQSSRSGVNKAIATVEGIRSEIDSSRKRQQSIKKSIDDVINDPSNRAKE